MATMQIKNMPDALHRQLSEHARQRGISMSQVAVDAIRRAIAYGEFSARLAGRATTELGCSAADLLHEARSERGEKRPR